MRRDTSGFAIAILTLVLVGLSTGFSTAQDAGQEKPPISVGGYSYEFLPKGRIHMFECEVESCVPGSKVSYQLYAPEKNPDFEEYKKNQSLIASLLKKNVPKGTIVEFGTPKRTDGKAFTVFDTTREQQLPAGAKWFTKSMMVYGQNVTISLISSSKDESAVDPNHGKFLAGLMLWGQSLNKNPE